jgi:hypothetical protein
MINGFKLGILDPLHVAVPIISGIKSLCKNHTTPSKGH